MSLPTRTGDIDNVQHLVGSETKSYIKNTYYTLSFNFAIYKLLKKKKDYMVKNKRDKNTS